MKFSPKLAGMLAFLGLLLFYFLVLSALNSPAHAFEEFSGMWYWILLLAFGFGVQIGLFVYAHSRAATAAASGGVSGLAMVACCAHHLTDVLPLIGLEVFTVFLVRYQTAFIVLALASNAIGIAFIVREMQKHGVKGRFDGLFKKLDFNVVFKVILVFCLAVVAVAFIAASKGLI